MSGTRRWVLVMAALAGACSADSASPTDPGPLVAWGGSAANAAPPKGTIPPVADPGGPYVAAPGTALTLDGSASDDPDGPNSRLSYTWSFGDGGTGEGKTPTHTYAVTGTFTVGLIVTDRNGFTSAPATTTATISAAANQPPSADPGGPYAGNEGAPVTLNGSASVDPDGTIDSYAWDFGDGSAGTGVSPTHTYAVAGDYTLVLTVTDDGGATGSDSTTTNVSGPSPGQPTADPGGPYAGVEGTGITFDGTASNDPDGPNGRLAYAWSFGDGSTATGKTPTHTYAVAGTFTVELTVTDRNDLTSVPATTTATISAAANQPPSADPGGPYSGNEGAPVTFDGSASVDPDGTIDSYGWTFGDGSAGIGISPTHTYAAAGSYTVVLTVTDDDGATGIDSTTATISAVANQAPTADPGGPYAELEGTPVAMDGSASSDPDGTIDSYAWDFGDGGTDTTATPSHTYAAAGSYTVVLTVTDDDGATGIDSTTATISGNSGGAVRTTSQPGFWSDPSTWEGAPAPGDGDRAIVRHAVTLAGDVVLGLHSFGGGTLDLDVQPGGYLTLAANSVLRVKGNVEYAGKISVGSGAQFLQDAPGGETYSVNLKAGAPAGTTIEVRGDEFAEGLVDLNAGAGVGTLASVFRNHNGVLDFEYGIFRGGDNGNPNHVWVGDGDHFRFIDSRMENSAGLIQHRFIASGGRVTIVNSTWVGTVSPEALILYRYEDPAIPGTTVYQHSVFDRTVWIEGPDADIDGCYLAAGLITSPGKNVFPRTVRNSLVRRTVAGSMNINGDYLGNLHLEDYPTGNPHGVQLDSRSLHSTVSGNVFKYTGTSGDGDMLTPRSGGTTANSVMVTGNLVLPNGDSSGPSGTLISLLGSANWTVAVERNTYVVVEAKGGVAIAETYLGHSGLVTSITSNLAYGLGAATGSIVHDVSTPVPDYVSEADYNGYHNLGPVRYDALGSAFAAAPGTFDVGADPQFVDETRDLDSYDAAWGGPGTVSHLLSEVARMNDSDFNPAFEPWAIRDWIREGWRPQNPVLQGAGQAGVDIGAIPF